VALAHAIWPSARIDAATVALLVIAVVPWLAHLLHLAPNLKSVELPGGVKLEFQPQSADEQKERLDESAEEVVDEGPTLSAEGTGKEHPTTGHAPESATSRKSSRITMHERYVLAEDLVLRLLDQGEFRGTIRRQVKVKGSPHLAFDAVGQVNGRTTLIEVKYTKHSLIPTTVMRDLLNRIRGVADIYHEADAASGPTLLLAIVAEREEQKAQLRRWAHDRWSREESLDIRIYDFDSLKQQFGIGPE
jgi:hypothetical protein